MPAPLAPVPTTPDPKTRVPNSLPVNEPDERTLCVIRRHPIGVITVYSLCAIVLITTLILCFAIMPGLTGGNDRQAFLGSALVFVVVAAICAFYIVIATTVFRGNSWVLTTDSLTQVRQFSLFNRQSSQLSLKDLEDVTAEQHGVIAKLLNYGTLRVETAGETSKFIFPLCPNPNYYAQQILEAREIFERNRRATEPIDDTV